MIAPVDRSAELFADLRSRGAKTLHEGDGLVRGRGERWTHSFGKFAAEVSQKVKEMREFIEESRRAYKDYSGRGMSEEERDEIDAAIAQFLRSCMEKIELLKREGVDELERRTPDMSFAAHKLGVVVILNGQLQAVSKLSEELRGLRIRHAIEENSKPVVKYDTNLAKRVAEERRLSGALEESSNNLGEDAEFAMYEQEFAQENASLKTELIDTLERVREAEKTVAEIASLNHVFATKVLEQAREIEDLYDMAVESMTFVAKGNKEIKRMRRKGGYLMLWMALILFLLTLFVLLLYKLRV